MEIPVEQLSEKIQEIAANTERSHAKEFAATAQRIVKALSSVERAAAKLGQATKQAWGSLSRPAEQHGVRLSEDVLKACKSLTTFSQVSSYDELKKFQKDSLEVTRLIVKAYNKYVGSIMRSLKSEVSILEESIADLGKWTTELSRVLDGSNLGRLRLAILDADRLTGSARELRTIIDEIQRRTEMLSAAQTRATKLHEDVSLIRERQDLKELSRIDQQIRRTEGETAALLEPLSKPLRKLDRPDRYASFEQHRSTVSRFAEDPVAAVFVTPVSELRALLRSLQETIESEELSLESRRKRKSIESIQALLAGELERLREDHAVLQANRQEVVRQLKASGAYDQWRSLEDQLEKTQAEVAECQTNIAELRSQEVRLRRHILADKSRMESVLKELVGESVSITVSF